MKTRILKRLSRTTALLLCVLLAAGVFACNNRQTAALFINVPEAVQQAECGVYTVPDFEVVDANGEIHSEYSVTLKSAKDPDGGAVTLLQDGKAINADKIGTYSLTFTASGVADAVLKVAFTKAPPTVVLDEETEIPEYYFKGVRYPIPQFSYGGGADLSKSNLKLYHVAPDSANREEIDLSGGGFTAAFATGSYVIVIHAEGSFGNAKDYEYTVLAADGPSEIVQGKIGYFDEEFGLKQATGLRGNEANITTEYVTDTRYKDEAGSLKVTFTEWDDRNLLQLGNLLESDISDYEYLVYRVYNPNEFRLMAGWGWFGDTSCPAGRWTTVSVPVSSINGDNYAGIPTASSSDVTGLCIRVAGHDVVAGVVPLPADTSFYISALYAIPYPAATPPTEGERVSGKIGYFDTEYGLQQIEAETGKFDNIETEYVTDKYYGAEAGSIKVTFTFWDADNLLRLRNLFETDVSDYDYLVYRVYNPNDFDMMAGYAWFGDTTCKQNAWTAISVDLLNGLPNSGRTAADITGLGIRVAGAGGTAVPAGTSFYISALYAGKISSATAPTAESGKIGYFDTEFGENQVLARPGGFDNITAEYSAVVKYGAEAGSLKVTFTTWDADYNLLRLRNLLESDVSGYDYLIYRVYNPNAYAFTASYAWFGDTNCAANSWTEVCVTTAAVNGAENATAANVTGLGIRVFGGGVTDGTVFYISAMYAVHKPSDIVSGKIGYFDTEFGVHQVTAKDYAGSTPPVEYSTAYKYGTEDGSLKVTYWTTDQGLVLRNLFETDVSGYDYLVYRVYNPNAYAITAGYEWFGDVSCPAGQWTEILVPTSVTFNGGGSKTNLTGLPVRFFGDSSVVGVGTTVYISALYAINGKPQAVTGKIGYFDTEFGVHQVTARGYTGSTPPVEYSTAYKYGTEDGSLKVTYWTTDQALVLRNLLFDKDVSSYDYLIYRVYNPNESIVLAGYEWYGETRCLPHTWTEVRIPASTNFLYGGAVTDLTGLPVRVFGASAGTVVYISAMYAVNSSEGLKIGYFDEAAGVSQVTPTSDNGVSDPAVPSVEYSTAYKYGAEDGCLKVTTTEANAQLEFSFPTVKDMTGYTYLVYRVYNPTAANINAGYLWFGDTVCAPGQWTEVKVDLAYAIANSTVIGTNTVTNIDGLRLRLFAANTTYYISALYMTQA